VDLHTDLALVTVVMPVRNAGGSKLARNAAVATVSPLLRALSVRPGGVDGGAS